MSVYVFSVFRLSRLIVLALSLARCKRARAHSREGAKRCSVVGAARARGDCMMRGRTLYGSAMTHAVERDGGSADAQIARCPFRSSDARSGARAQRADAPSALRNCMFVVHCGPCKYMGLNVASGHPCDPLVHTIACQVCDSLLSAMSSGRVWVHVVCRVNV